LKPQLTIGLLILAIAVVGFLASRRPAPPAPPAASALKVPGQTGATNVNANARPTSGSGVSPNSPDFRLRPFPVASESARTQWTSADGKDTNVIRQLAHNELEYRRMVEENPRIQRRQLVYSKDPTAALLQRSRLSGEPVKELTVPGFDGQELPFVINRADLEPSRQAGTFTGHLPDRPNSMVTLSFKFGREAFTVLSPDDGIYLQAWPRESGEIILTSFDPAAYQALPGGEPIRTTNSFKIAQ
jgi:hypothetical protein